MLKGRIFKKGIKSDLNNYRPISVIPIISKVFERIVYNQLFHYLDDNKLLLGCQSGFCSLHSTLTALLEATNAWSVNIDNGLLNGVVFIDLTKAFDTIDHEIILRKMSYLGVDQAAIKWFSSYLSGRTQRCNVTDITNSNLTLVIKNTYDMLNIIFKKCFLVSVGQEKLLNFVDLKQIFILVFILNIFPNMLQIALQSIQISKIFRGSMPPDPPSKLRASPFDFNSHGNINSGGN